MLGFNLGSIKAMHLPKNFAILQKSKVESRIVSTVENRPVYVPWFRMSENFAKLTENFPENRNIQNMSKLSKMVEIVENDQNFWTYKQRPSYTEWSKNTKSCFSRPLSVLGWF